MYLTKKTYIGANFEHVNVRGVIYLTTGKECKEISIKVNRVSYIDEQIGYWRKENAIHAWFVREVQGGEDDCGDYYVDSDKLQALLLLCKAVVEDHGRAAELLPTQGGFFFGPVKYDEYYFAGIENTIQIIEGALKEEGGDIYYHSSW